MDIFKELLFEQYYELKGIVGDSFDDETIFAVVADVFCISKEERAAYYAETRREIVSEIRTATDYARYKRIKEYEEMHGHPALCDKETDALITIKGEAFKAVAKYKLEIPEDATDVQISGVLSEHAYRGNIAALRVLGVLQCEEFAGYEGSKEKGLEKLTKAARWNDLFSAMALLRYDETNRAENAKILAAVLSDSPYGCLAEKLSARYGVAVEERSLEVLVIKKAIAHNKIDPLHYDTSIGCVAFSPAMNIEDKKRVVYTGNLSLIGEVCELPLGLHYMPLQADVGAFDRVSLDLSSAKEAICNNLANIDLRGKALYLPLCLSAESDYVSRLTVSLVKELFLDAKVIKVEACDLKPKDLVRSKNNAFIRDLSRNRNNVLLFVIGGAVEEVVLDEIADFLSGEKRAAFKLDEPAISIDLSSVLPICICDRENARKLSRETEVVELSARGEQNRTMMVDAVFEERKKAFGLTELKLSEAAAKLIASLEIDLAESVIDRMIRAYRAKGGEPVVTEEAVRGSIKALKVKTFGFGGNDYDED